MSKTKKQLLEILKDPDYRLRAPNVDVTIFSQELIRLAQDMIYTMNKVRGVGIAASQVKCNTRMIIALINKQPLVLLNPEVAAHADEQVSIEEACLSCPTKAVRIPRYYWVEVAYDTIKGKTTKGRFEGINSIIIQHEIDHVRPEGGKLIVDYAPQVEQTA
jgi:peptide deformylase